MKIQEKIRTCFLEALERLDLDRNAVEIVLEKPRLKAHGDISCPVAMSLAKKLRKNPLDIAEKIAKAVKFPKALIASIEVAPPGFINLTFSHDVLINNLKEILARKND